MSQPRVPAGWPGGGRFTTGACPATYRRLVDASEPLPPAVRAPAEFDGMVSVSTVAVSGSGAWQAVPAPRCPHGHFARWAANHCRRCAGLTV